LPEHQVRASIIGTDELISEVDKHIRVNYFAGVNATNYQNSGFIVAWFDSNPDGSAYAPLVGSFWQDDQFAKRRIGIT